MLVLRPTVSEPELWIIIEEMSGVMYGLMVLYVDDIAYFSSEDAILAVHEYIVSEWPSSDLEWITESNSVRYLGVEIGRELRTSENGEVFRVYTIGQAAYVQDLLQACNMTEVSPTALPVPKEWVESAENDEPRTMTSLLCAKPNDWSERCCGWELGTRPDLMFVITHAASLVAKRPSYVVRLGMRLLSYLAGTSDLRMTI